MKKFDALVLRKKNFTQFLNTEIKEAYGKKRTFCPFHKEQTPSFFIYPDNTFHCFGCWAHGNAIDFLIKKFGYSFKEACTILENL